MSERDFDKSASAIDVSTMTREDRIFFAARSFRLIGVMELLLKGDTDTISPWEVHHAGEHLVSKVATPVLVEWQLSKDDMDELLEESCSVVE